MNILYCCDNMYSPYTGVSITSLFENNKGLCEINVYIIGLDISPDNQLKLKKTAEKYSRVIKIIKADEVENALQIYGIRDLRDNKATYYRLFIDTILPEDLGKLLYIDADTIICGDLCELESFEFEDGKACAMVRYPLHKGFNTLIEMEEGANYYNAGVILFNMSNWKKYDCYKRILEAIKDNNTKYIYHDQDFLCKTINENIQILSLKYNVTADLLLYSYRYFLYIYDVNESNFYTKDEISNALNKPSILHCLEGFTGTPWQQGNFNPFNEAWHNYKAMSFWHDMTDIKKVETFVKIIRRTLYRFLPLRLYSIFHKFAYKLYHKKVLTD